MPMSHKEALEEAAVRSAMFPIPDDEYLVAFLRAYLDARGLVMVPKEPTGEMVRVGTGADMNLRTTLGTAIAKDRYSAMLAAAPDPFGGE